MSKEFNPDEFKKMYPQKATAMTYLAKLITLVVNTCLIILLISLPLMLLTVLVVLWRWMFGVWF
jgi:hypothetical protein